MRFFPDSFQTVCIPGNHFVFLAEVANGKFLRADFLETDDPASAMRSAKEAGFSGNRLILAATFSTLRIKTATFPDMSEEELASTLCWEKDTLFLYPDPEMRTYTLSHSPDGYRVLAAAIPKETLSVWQEAAKTAKKRISHIYPIFSPGNPETPGTVFLCGQKAAHVLLWENEQTVTVKTIRKDDENSIREILETAPNFLWYPMTDCDDTTIEEWQNKFTAKENVSHETSKKELYFSLALRLATMNNPLNFADPQDTKSLLKEWTSGDHPWLIGAALSGLLFLGALGESVHESALHNEALQQQAALSDARIAMQKTQEQERTRKAKMEECRLFFAENGDWQKKLVTLADSLPAGVTITSIEADHDIRICGTTTKSEDVNTLARLLSLSWEQKVRRESVKREDGRTLLQFSLRAEKEVPHETE